MDPIGFDEKALNRDFYHRECPQSHQRTSRKGGGQCLDALADYSVVFVPRQVPKTIRINSP